MQRLKSLSSVVVSRSLQSHSYRYATVSAQTYTQNNHFQDEVFFTHSIDKFYKICFRINKTLYLCKQVIVEGRAFSRAAILNRPSKLNAITTSMVRTTLLLLFTFFDY